MKNDHTEYIKIILLALLVMAVTNHYAADSPYSIKYYDSYHLLENLTRNNLFLIFLGAFICMCYAGYILLKEIIKKK